MIREVIGDIWQWQSEVQAVIHGVNCEGYMNAGIAAQVRSRYPEVFEAYRDMCHYPHLVPGMVHAAQGNDTFWIYNLASQGLPGPHAELDAIEYGLHTIVQHSEKIGLTKIALPEVGAGIGGLILSDVMEVFRKKLTDSKIEFILVHWNKERKRCDCEGDHCAGFKSWHYSPYEHELYGKMIPEFICGEDYWMECQEI